MKLALKNIDLKIRLTKSLKYKFDILNIILASLAIDQDIIEISLIKVVDILE